MCVCVLDITCAVCIVLPVCMLVWSNLEEGCLSYSQLLSCLCEVLRISGFFSIQFFMFITFILVQLMFWGHIGEMLAV